MKYIKKIRLWQVLAVILVLAASGINFKLPSQRISWMQL